MEVSTAMLTAVRGEPLADVAVRAVVVSAAGALAERTGVKVVRIEATASGVQVVVEGPEVVAVGFVAELRRVTNAWWAGRRGKGVAGESLWGEAW
jgi:hypothetical protein